MLDRFIRLVVLALGALIVFASGYATGRWTVPVESAAPLPPVAQTPPSPQPVPAPSAAAAAPAARNPAPTAFGPPGLDVPVKRVRTVPVRPLDTGATPSP